MKKIIAIITVIMLLAAMPVSAAETNNPSTRPIREENNVNREARHEKMLELFEAYAPDLSEAFVTLTEEHHTFHEARQILREDYKTDIQTSTEAIRASVEAGELTREEAYEAIMAIREENQDLKNLIQPILEEKKVALEEEKAINQEIREALKTALDADVIDEEAVYDLLIQVIDQLEAHIAIDLDYADQIDAVLSFESDMQI